MNTIDTLEAGRELDALVAEKVMGIPVVWSSIPPYMEPGKPLDPHRGRLPYLKGTANGCTYDWATVPDYSTNIAAAWRVVEKLTLPLGAIIDDDGTERFGSWSLDRLGFDCCKDGKPDVEGAHGQYRCHFSMNRSEDERVDVFATADTAPLAICRAALKAIDARENGDAE